MADTIDAIVASLAGAAPPIGQATDSSTDWMIFKGSLPDSAPTSTGTKAIADRAICVYGTPGRPPLEAWAVDYPSVQIVGRGKPDDYTALRAKMFAIFGQLHANEEPLGADFVYCYATHSEPLLMGIDEKRRMRMSWNFRMMRNRQA